MRVNGAILVAVGVMACGLAAASARQGAAQVPAAPDSAQMLVDRLDLDKYKATIKGLAQFGDRREGTERNREAVSWIEAQLKSYGCVPERMEYELPARGGGGGQRAGAGAAGRGAAAQSGQAARGTGGGQGTGTGQGRGRVVTLGPLPEPVRGSSGGSTLYGNRGRTGVNNNPDLQPDERLRQLNSGPVLPGPIPQVYCTKVGTTRPGEVYIIGGHMDGIGYGEAANDDASGSAIVMELARILSASDVTTEVSIRFALWNGEEGGLRGANAYVAQRQALQGREDPAGSGRYPEPRWLGMIQHDMMLWDHGMPHADGSLSPDQRPEADFNIEFQSNSKMADASMRLAFAVKAAADRYSKNYPGTVGPHMTNTDSGPFQDLVAAISMRENERGMHTGAGWNPHWHQPTDLYTTFSDKDFLLGLNSAEATLAAIAQLAGARVK
jgi:hypothetical protein